MYLRKTDNAISRNRMQNQITKVSLTYVSPIEQTLKAWSDLVYRDQEPMFLTLFRGGFLSIRLRGITHQG